MPPKVKRYIVDTKLPGTESLNVAEKEAHSLVTRAEGTEAHIYEMDIKILKRFKVSKSVVVTNEP